MYYCFTGRGFYDKKENMVVIILETAGKEAHHE
jgi:hypothetical protein